LAGDGPVVQWRMELSVGMPQCQERRTVTLRPRGREAGDEGLDVGLVHHRSPCRSCRARRSTALRLAEIGLYNACMAPNRLILDTDGGVDDAQALLLLIANGRPPDAITTVFGNVSLDAATGNILAVLAAAGACIPVHAGAGEPLAQPRIDARHVHG